MIRVGNVFGNNDVLICGFTDIGPMFFDTGHKYTFCMSYVTSTAIRAWDFIYDSVN